MQLQRHCCLHEKRKPGSHEIHRRETKVRYSIGLLYLPVRWQWLIAAGSGYNVLLIDDRRHELVAIEPDHGLLVVRIGPERMEYVIGANSQIRVIPDKPAAELAAGVNGVGADGLAYACGEVC